MRRDKVVSLVKKTLDEHKATDIQVIDVSERTPFAEFYVIASAGNIRQLDALANIVIDELEKNKINVNHKEGTPESGWILIDVYHVIVNIFTESERQRIALEEVLSKK